MRGLLGALDRPRSAVAVVPRILLDSDVTPSEDALMELSERTRAAGAAALIVRGSALDGVKLLLEEQRRAAGNYPGPLPIVFEPAMAIDAAAVDALHTAGAAGILLPSSEPLLPPSPPPSAPPLLVVPRCESAVELRSALGSAPPPALLFAAVELGDDGAPLDAVSSDGAAAPIVMAWLRLGDELAERARAGTSTLRVLDVSANAFGTSDAAAAAGELLRAGGRLERLRISDNFLGASGAHLEC